MARNYAPEVPLLDKGFDGSQGSLSPSPSGLAEAGISSVSTSSNTATATRRSLDKKLAALEHAAREVKTKINILSPIHRLPPEVIAHIFSILSEVHPPQVIPRYWGRLGWIVVSHVCRHWRHVALDNPRLWCNDVLSHPKWTLERLSRSKKAPMTVQLHLAKFSDDTVPQKILEDTHRIQEMVLSAPYSAMQGFIQDFLNRPAPLLEALELTSRWSYNLHDGITNFPSDPFAGQYPRLKKLVLREYACPQKPLFYCNLTHVDLHLTRSSSATNKLSSFDCLLSILQSMGQLQYLKLSNVLCSGHPTSSDRNVVLSPSIHTFSLTDDARLCLILLEHLTIPPSASFTLMTHSMDHSDDACSHILPLLHRHDDSKKGTLDTLQSLYVVCNASNFLCMRGWKTSINMEDLTSNTINYPAPTIDIILRWMSPKTSSEMLVDALHGLCVADVKTLRIEGLRLPYNVWMHTFDRFTAIEGISVTACAWPFQMLARDIRSEGEKSVDPVSRSLHFPNLRIIRVAGVNFDDDDGGVYRGLVDTLLDRLSQNNLLDVLDIVGCDISREWVENLRQIVPTVSWDGSEGRLWEMYESEEDEDEDADYMGMDDGFEDGYEFGDPWEDDSYLDEFESVQEILGMFAA